MSEKENNKLYWILGGVGFIILYAIGHSIYRNYKKKNAENQGNQINELSDKI